MTLTQYAVHAISNKDVRSLFKFFLLIVKQERLLELLYGISCFALYKPSPVIETSDFNLDQISHLVGSLIKKKRREQYALKLLLRRLTEEEGDRKHV